MTIKDSDYEELKKLDIGSWFGEEWKEETIPLLNEVLDLIPKKKRDLYRSKNWNRNN